MLGINVKRTPIKGKFAEDIKARINRIQSNTLNDKDREEIRKHHVVMSNHVVIWKTK